MEYTYSTKDTPKGKIKYRHWAEEFKDESGGESVFIERKEPIELDGNPLQWYSNSEISRMSKEEQQRLLL